MALAQSNSIRGEVTVRHLSKTYTLNGKPLSVLKDLNLTIRSGESLAIVGASGSGKTTLLRILAGLEDADSGDVLIDGRPPFSLGTAAFAAASGACAGLKDALEKSGSAKISARCFASFFASVRHLPVKGERVIERKKSSELVRIIDLTAGGRGHR